MLLGWALAVCVLSSGGWIKQARLTVTGSDTLIVLGILGGAGTSELLLNHVVFIEGLLAAGNMQSGSTLGISQAEKRFYIMKLLVE